MIEWLRYGTVIRVKLGHPGRPFFDERRWMVVCNDPARQVIHTIFLDLPSSPIEWTHQAVADSFEVVER